MRKHDFSYFFGEGMRNMFSHGFMSFAAVGITVACLVVMGTFSLVAYNAQVQLQQLESEYEILAFVDESCDDAQTKAVGRAIEQRDNVKECVFISKEEAMKSFEARYEGDNMFQNLDPEILRDRYAVYVDDLSISRARLSRISFDNVEGVAKVPRGRRHRGRLYHAAKCCERSVHRAHCHFAARVGLHHLEYHQAHDIRPPRRDRHYEDGRRDERLHPAGRSCTRAL